MMTVSPPPFNGGVITNNLEIKGSLLLRDPASPTNGGMFQPHSLADGYVYLKRLDDSDRGQLLGEFMPTILTQNVIVLSKTGDLLEGILANITVFSNYMGPNGLVCAGIHLEVAGTNGTKTYRVKFGATTLKTIVVAAGTVAEGDLFITIQNDNNTSAQKCSVREQNLLGTYDSNISCAENTTLNKAIRVTGQLANALDTIATNGYWGDVSYKS